MEVLCIHSSLFTELQNTLHRSLLKRGSMRSSLRNRHIYGAGDFASEKCTGTYRCLVRCA